MAKAKNIDTSLSTFYFFLITLFLTIIKQYLHYDSAKSEMVWSGIYLLATLISQFILNLGLTSDVCGVAQYTLAFYATFIPWMIVFGVLQILLILFPGWLRPFSNTFGYFAARLMDPDTLIQNIFKKPEDAQGGTRETLNHIFNDSSQILNELPTNADKLEEALNKMGKEMVALESPMHEDPNFKQLAYVLYLKDNISYMIWYLLAGLTVINISKSYIIGSSCEKTLDEMEDNYEDYLKDKSTASSDVDRTTYNT